MNKELKTNTYYWIRIFEKSEWEIALYRAKDKSWCKCGWETSFTKIPFEIDYKPITH